MEKNAQIKLRRLYDKLLEAQDLLEELQEDLQELAEEGDESLYSYAQRLAACENALEAICEAMEDRL